MSDVILKSIEAEVVKLLAEASSATAADMRNIGTVLVQDSARIALMPDGAERDAAKALLQAQAEGMAWAFKARLDNAHRKALMTTISSLASVLVGVLAGVPVRVG